MPRSTEEQTRARERYDFVTVSPTEEQIYVGTALLGTATSAKKWTIKRITLVNGNPTEKVWTKEYGAIWDDRLTETYA